MIERLTQNDLGTGFGLKLDAPQNEFEARQQLMSKFKLACAKLGKIEDLMEIYNLPDVGALENELIMKRALIEECQDYENKYYQLKEMLPKFKQSQEVLIVLKNEICAGIIDSYNYYSRFYTISLYGFVGQVDRREEQIFLNEEDAKKYLEA